MMRRNKNFTLWPSPIPAALAAEASLRLSEITSAGGRAIWIESRPAERGRGVLVAAPGKAGGAPRDLTAASWSARTRVHEYGGGALLGAGEAVFFVNHADQDIYELPADGDPVRVSADERTRFADMDLDGGRHRLLAVGEYHGEEGHPQNFIAAVALEAGRRGAVERMIEGADFYAHPRVAPDGRTLCWLEWNLPDMPWEGAALKCAALDDAGRPGKAVTIAGGRGGAAFQPEWAGDGSLLFVLEKGEWSGLYCWRDGEIRPLFTPNAELLRPLWALSLRSYAMLGETHVAAVAVREGEHELWLIERQSGHAAQMALPHRCIDDLAAAGDMRIYALVCDDDAVPAICEADFSSGGAAWRRLARPGEMNLPPGAISRGTTRRFVAGAGQSVPAVHYPPCNRGHRAEAPPPMIVMAHGGPTGSAARGLQLKTQFWTSRGFAVLDVDYRGSTGYGRAHREALDGHWGEYDADDVIAAAEAAVDAGLADGERLVVTGRSAGGFTALCALMRSDIFRAASVHFGVADLATLLETTHKFEAGYLYRLTGTTPGKTGEVFAARSPLAQADRISSPVLLLQGLEDPAVPPSQARDIAASLKGRGVPVAHLEFAGEGHGFRKAETIRAAFLADLAFFSRVLDLGCEENLPDLTVFNWDEE